MMKQILYVLIGAVVSTTSTMAFVPSVSRVATTTTSRPLYAEEKDRDYEAEIVKMEKEALDRLETKSNELMSNIASTGGSK